MWRTEFSATSDLPREVIWSAIADLHSGVPLTEHSDRFVLHGPFEVGTELSVTPAGQETFRSRIIELVENEVYADETPLEGFSLVFRHRLHPHGAHGTHVVHELVIDGPAADQVGPQLGAQISEDFPQAMADLLEAAGRRAAGRRAAPTLQG
jgi:hypothetical protein